ncbi:hypothetical protein [Bacillus rubiinfantis]|uniref:hypothetical protein n=1 Tax=Bacillus rubiinfantis TaxID=1499680 RepID=UPI0005A6E393|nr:hypothetical protein [Bacillus rubiinfantis]
MWWKAKEAKRMESQSWFSYTVVLPGIDEDDQEVMIMGNYIIKNSGNGNLHNPIICIKITPHHDVHLGGKIGSPTHTALAIDGSNSGAWEYIDDNWKESALETGEHWLRPKGVQELASNHSIAFAHEIRFPLQKKEKYVNIDGFIYFDELKDGSPALNKISVNY